MPGTPSSVLIAAVSARALAQAARRDGYAPLVADLFGDDDTREAADAHERLPGGLARGIGGDALISALARLSRDRAPEGLVCGAGFESRPNLLEQLSRRHTLLGNRADVVRRVKDPASLAAQCAQLNIPHPEIRLEPTSDAGWVSKRIGGAGGSHVRSVRPGQGPGRGRYLQRRVSGRPVSALLLSGADLCHVVGFSEQWAAPHRRHPFRYGGATRPASLAPWLSEALTQAACRFATAAGLVGLTSVDFLVGADGFHLVEVNPRPGATLDVFAQSGLFQAHLDACRGEPVQALRALPSGAATAIAYAHRPLRLPPGFSWPDWASDRQPVGLQVARHAPLCTVRAEADDADAARELAVQRTAIILSRAEGSG